MSGGRAVTILNSEEMIRERVEAVARQIAAAPLKPDVALPILAGG